MQEENEISNFWSSIQKREIRFTPRSKGKTVKCAAQLKVFTCHIMLFCIHCENLTLKSDNDLENHAGGSGLDSRPNVFFNYKVNSFICLLWIKDSACKFISVV